MITMSDMKLPGRVVSSLLLIASWATSATYVVGHSLNGAGQSLRRLEILVPFEPTTFPSVGSSRLFYELHIRNAWTVPITLRRIEVIDAAGGTRKAIAAVETDELSRILEPIVGQTS